MTPVTNLPARDSVQGTDVDLPLSNARAAG